MSPVETVSAPVLQEPTTTELHLHPLARLFPAMSDSEYQRLKSDIKAHGVQLPILTLEHQILDGRHRAQACRELGLEYPTVEVSGDAASLVASLNLHRRHLAPDQIAAIHLLLDDGLKKAPEPKPHVRPEPRRLGKAAAEVAKKIGVGRATVERVAAVKRKAPEKVKDIAEGKARASKILREMKGKGAARPSTTKEKPALASTTPKIDALEMAALALQRFSDEKDLQKELRSVLDRAQVLAQRYPVRYLGLAVFYAHVAKSFDDGSVKRLLATGKGGAR